MVVYLKKERALSKHKEIKKRKKETSYIQKERICHWIFDIS